MTQPTGTCTECGEQAVGTVVDFGIGSYEFWGAPGTDIQLCLVSQCCEAQMRDGAGDLMYYEDYHDECEL